MGGMPIYVQGELPERAELTEGEGTGESRGVELPPEVEEIIARAVNLGHVGWAERSAWEYRADRGPETLHGSLIEAANDLDELEAAQPLEATVELPVNDADLPEPKAWAADDPNPPTVAAPPAPSAAEGSAEGESVAQDLPPRELTEEPPEEDEPTIDVEVLRKRLAAIQKKKAKTPEAAAARKRLADLRATQPVEEEQKRQLDEEIAFVESQLPPDEKLRDEEIDWIESELMRAATARAREDEGQASLL